MPKPVEIELLMIDKTSGKLKIAGKEVDNLKVKVKGANKELNKTKSSSDRLAKSLKALTAAFTAREIVKNVAMVRGEFQQLEVAFATMLGSAEKADSLMKELTHTAAVTPFEMKDVAQGAKQLLAYGFEADKVNATLIRLGDVAAGLSIPLNDLVYLYGTTMAQGRLYTQDLNQFTNRGIPMIAELAKQFGVAESEVKGLVETGKVGFPEVQKVIENLTNKGGKFGGLMEEQSKTIIGQISNIEDAVDMMFNKIGKSQEGVINASLSGVSYVVEHYERFGRLLLGIAGTYGTYRTAVMLVVAAKRLHVIWGKKELFTSIALNKAMRTLNATMLTNPYVLVATAVAGLVTVMMSLKTESERLQEANKSYEDSKQKLIEAEDKHRQMMEELIGLSENESLSTDTRREALNRLEQKYPDIFSKYDTEYDKLKHIHDIKLKIAQLEDEKSEKRPENELKRLEAQIARLKEKEASIKWVTVNTSAGAMTQKVGGLSSEEEIQLKVLEERREKLNKALRRDEVQNSFAHLTGLSNEQLERMISQREDLLANMQLGEQKSGEITQGESRFKGTFNKDELQYQLNKLKAEQNERNAPLYSSSEIVNHAKNEYESALKAYNEFIDNRTNALTEGEFSQKAASLKETLEIAKKAYDKFKPSGQEENHKKEKEAAQRKKIQSDLEAELLELQQKSKESELSLLDDTLDKRLQLISLAYEKEKESIARKEAEWKEKNNTLGLTSELTQKQQEEIDRAYQTAAQRRQKAILETYQGEFSAMRNFLAEYGTFQQQKLSIAKEYAEKILQAQSLTERHHLEVERDSKLASVSSAEIKDKVDWTVVFGEFGSMFSGIVRPVLAEAKQYMATDEFKNADHDSQQALVEAIMKMEEHLGASEKVNFKKLGNEISVLERSLNSLQTAQVQYKNAFDNLQEAQSAYTHAMMFGTEAEKANAKAVLSAAEEQTIAAEKNVQTMSEQAEKAKQMVSTTATSLKSSLDGVVDGLQMLTSGSLSGAYEGLIGMGQNAQKLGGKFGDLLGNLAKNLQNVPILGLVLQILDILKEGLSTLITGLLDTIFSIVINLLVDLIQGRLFIEIFKSITKGIAGIFDALTFGGFSKWISSSNAKQVQRTIDRLTDRNEKLKVSIDALTEEMKASRGKKSVEAYRRAKENQEQRNQNYLDIAKAQAGYHGSHKSWNKRWSGFREEEMAWIRENIKKDFNGDLFSLTPEEMKQLRSNVSIWEHIQNTGEGNYGGRLTEKLDDYIDQAGQLEELTNSLYEGLTGISFDGMYSSFIDNLMNMEYSAKDAADNMSEYFMKAMLSNQIGELYSEKLKEWWKKFGKSMEDGNLSEDERKVLEEEYLGYVKEAVKLRDEVAKATGYDSQVGKSQSGKAGGFSAMTQEQGTKLEGMFTSGLQHWSSMDTRMEDISEKMNTAESRLAHIEENTGISASHLSQIKEDVKKMMRDGLKMK